jgi:hypothetical protein
MYDDLWPKKEQKDEIKMTKDEYALIPSIRAYKATRTISDYVLGDLAKPDPPIEWSDHALVIEIESIINVPKRPGHGVVKMRMKTIRFIKR